MLIMLHAHGVRALGVLVIDCSCSMTARVTHTQYCKGISVVSKQLSQFSGKSLAKFAHCLQMIYGTVVIVATIS